jgi:hypothetical protein
MQVGIAGRKGSPGIPAFKFGVLELLKEDAIVLDSGGWVIA